MPHHSKTKTAAAAATKPTSHRSASPKNGKPSKTNTVTGQSKINRQRSPSPVTSDSDQLEISGNDHNGREKQLRSNDENTNRNDSDSDADYTQVDNAHKRKRRLQRLSKLLADSSARKRPKSSDDLGAYKSIARAIPRIFSPFVNLLQAFQIGMQMGNNDGPGNDLDELIADLNEDDRIEANYIVNTLLELLPDLKDQLKYFEEKGDIDAFDNLISFLESHARFARTDDVGTLRYASMSYIPQVVGISPISVTNRNKGDRGFSHPASGRLLCPRSSRNEFDKDPEKYCRDVRDVNTLITADDWPSFLYPEDGYNVNAIDEGLLRGPFLVSCFQHIFTGPRTAMKATPGQASGKKSVSDLYNITSVSPRGIAYIAVLARFVLNGQEEWSVEDGDFNAIDFFKNIVDLFDEPEGQRQWSEATLEWWENQVFGAKARHRANRAKRKADETSGVSTLAAQRAARARNA